MATFIGAYIDRHPPPKVVPPVCPSPVPQPTPTPPPAAQPPTGAIAAAASMGALALGLGIGLIAVSVILCRSADTSECVGSRGHLGGIRDAFWLGDRSRWGRREAARGGTPFPGA